MVPSGTSILENERTARALHSEKTVPQHPESSPCTGSGVPRPRTASWDMDCKAHFLMLATIAHYTPQVHLEYFRTGTASRTQPPPLHLMFKHPEPSLEIHDQIKPQHQETQASIKTKPQHQESRTTPASGSLSLTRVPFSQQKPQCLCSNTWCRRNQREQFLQKLRGAIFTWGN